MYNVKLTIHIEEKDGAITVMGDIPDEAEKSIAALLAKQMIQFATHQLNFVTGQNVKMERHEQH